MSNLCRFLQIKIESELGEEVDYSEFDRINEYFLSINSPKCFNPFSGDAEQVKGDKQFESVCAMMEESGIGNVDRMNVFEFYSRIEFFDKRNEKLMQKYGNH